MSLPVAETRGGGEDVVLGEQEAAARVPVPACHRDRHQPGPGPITASAANRLIGEVVQSRRRPLLVNSVDMWIRV